MWVTEITVCTKLFFEYVVEGKLGASVKGDRSSKGSPGADRNEVRAAAGDDDFVEFLPIEWFRNVCDGDRVILGFTEKRIELLSPKRRAN